MMAWLGDKFFMKNLMSIRTALWRLLVRLAIFKKPSVKYCVAHDLLPRIITIIPGNTLREMLFLPRSAQVAQLNQDVFALLVNRFRSGYFIEIGANDGFTLSNTHYLEEHFEWSGVLIEANPKYADSLALRKKSRIVNKAISDVAGTTQFVDAGLFGGIENGLDSRHSQYTGPATRITVACATLDDVLDDVCAPSIIDFLSIDVEGGEPPIVRQLVKNKRRVRCGCVEVNDRKNDIAEISSLLNNSGYKVVWEGMTGNDLYFVDPKLLLPSS